MSEEKIDCVVVAWHPATRRRLGSGFVRTSETRETLFLVEEQIVTTGVETLAAGSYVRCNIGPADPGFSTRRSLDVEIYLIDAD
jgi:hypothetical protein